MRLFLACLSCLMLIASAVVHAETWQAPSLSWGDPDLQGTWTNATITGLERPGYLKTLVVPPDVARVVENRTEAFYDSLDDIPEGELPAGQDVGGYNTFWMDPGSRLAVVKGEIRSSLIVHPADGQLPYSPAGRRQLQQALQRITTPPDDPEQRLLGGRCIVGFGSTGGPPMLPVLYNNHYQIVQSPGYVVILVEMNHDARIIRLDGKRLPANVHRWLGDSIGHWDGPTLVVETTNFHPGQSFRASLRHQLYMSAHAKVTERFTRVGPREILYEFSVDDPDVFSQVWKGEMPLLAAEGQIYEYACHEGNYSLPSILSAARQED